MEHQYKIVRLNYPEEICKLVFPGAQAFPIFLSPDHYADTDTAQHVGQDESKTSKINTPLPEGNWNDVAIFLQNFDREITG